MLESQQLRKLRASATPESGNRIAVAVDLLGKTQREVAADLGMSDSQLSDMCRGRFANPQLTTLQKFAGYFGCQIEDLFPARDSVA